jgi:hypothetical protein
MECSISKNFDCLATGHAEFEPAMILETHATPISLLTVRKRSSLATTGLWDWNEWENGTYYSEPISGWANWSAKCTTLWAYQEHWFKCPSEKYLDLDSLSWVSSCNSSTQMKIVDFQLGGIPLWRSFVYYVNPLSTSVVELGTKAHPYKELSPVFVELMNFHSHTNRNISVFIMEFSTVYINTMSIINITSVHFESYSNTNLKAGKAQIIGIKSDSKIVHPSMPTKFHILSKL